MNEDEESVRRVLAGERIAFEDLVRRHQGAIRAFARSILGAGGDADDVSQEAFLSAWVHLASFDPVRGSFRAWLFTIARNLSKNRRRGDARRQLARAPALRPELAADERAAHREVFERLDRALDDLPEDQRVAFLLVEFQGFRLEEVSRMEGVPVGTVKSRVARARARLKEVLDERRSHP